MSATGPRRMEAWSSRPLCSNYFMVSFGHGVAVPSFRREVDGWTFRWALGTLDNGQQEVLGWWRQPGHAQLISSALCADLAARGVTRIRLVRNSAGESELQDTEWTWANSQVFEASTEAFAHSLKRKRQVADSDAVVQRIQRGLTRSVLRREPFEDSDEAGAFVDCELQRLDRTLWPSSVRVAVTPASRRKVAMPLGA